MDKRLIDADMLVRRLRNVEQALSLSDGYQSGRKQLANELADEIENGIYDHDPIPLPTIKTGDKEYICSECKEPSTSNEWNIATLKIYGSDIYLIEDDDKAITTLFVCPKCDSNVDFDCLEVSHD